MLLFKPLRLFVAIFVYICVKEAECQTGVTNTDDTGAKGNDSVKYYLVKKPLPGTRVELFTGDVVRLQRSGYQPTLKTLIVTHGWINSIESPSVTGVVNASLEFLNVNIIAVDWSILSMNEDYLKALATVPFAGEVISYFVDFLIEQGAPPKRIHVVGHSLGAHVAGFTGKGVKRRGHTLGRITGLDTAGPFIDLTENYRLVKDDARFVDCIHTDGGYGGLNKAIGDADYYPNRGAPVQPGCEDTKTRSFNENVCSHFRAPAFFSESINPKHHFYAHKCKVILEGVLIDCDKQTTAEMGYYTSPRDQGYFYLKTNTEYPFARNISE